MHSIRSASGFLAVRWEYFVAVFLYYVGLTMTAIGVQDLTTVFVLVSYLAPVAGYVVLLAVRVLARPSSSRKRSKKLLRPACTHAQLPAQA